MHVHQNIKFCNAEEDNVGLTVFVGGKHAMSSVRNSVSLLIWERVGSCIVRRLHSIK